MSGTAVVADGVPPSAITTIPVATGVGGAWHHENVTMSAPAMIGRDADLARLNERLDEVRAGAPFTVIIGGEAGIGKTRLIREFEAGASVRRPAARRASASTSAAWRRRTRR